MRMTYALPHRLVSMEPLLVGAWARLTPWAALTPREMMAKFRVMARMGVIKRCIFEGTVERRVVGRAMSRTMEMASIVRNEDKKLVPAAASCDKARDWLRGEYTHQRCGLSVQSRTISRKANL